MFYYLNSKNKNKNANYNNTINKNLKVLLKIDSLININTNNIKNKNKKNNKSSYKNSLTGLHKKNTNLIKNKYNFPPSNYLKCFSSSAKRFFPHGHMQYQSCISLTRDNLANKRSIHSPKQSHIMSLSASKKSNNSSSLKNLIKKCNLLKTKTNNILANYISLTEYIIKNSKNKI